MILKKEKQLICDAKNNVVMRQFFYLEGETNYKDIAGTVCQTGACFAAVGSGIGGWPSPVAVAMQLDKYSTDSIEKALVSGAITKKGEKEFLRGIYDLKNKKKHYPYEMNPIIKWKCIDRLSQLIAYQIGSDEKWHQVREEYLEKIALPLLEPFRHAFRMRAPTEVEVNLWPNKGDAIPHNGWSRYNQYQDLAPYLFIEYDCHKLAKIEIFLCFEIFRNMHEHIELAEFQLKMMKDYGLDPWQAYTIPFLMYMVKPTTHINMHVNLWSSKSEGWFDGIKFFHKRASQIGRGKTVFATTKYDYAYEQDTLNMISYQMSFDRILPPPYNKCFHGKSGGLTALTPMFKEMNQQAVDFISILQARKAA